MKRKSCSNSDITDNSQDMNLSNKEESRLRSLLFACLPVPATLILQIISLFAAMFLTVLFSGEISSLDLANRGILLLLRSTLYLIVFGFWFYQILRFTPEEKPFQKGSARFLIFSGMLGILLQILFSYTVQTLSGHFPEWFTYYNQNLSTLLPEGSSAITASMILFSVLLLSPVAEEIIFRGISYHYGKKLGGVTTAILISGVLFGFYHFELIQGSFAFIAGCVFAWLRKKSDSLLPGILCHILFNLTSYILLYCF